MDVTKLSSVCARMTAKRGVIFLEIAWNPRHIVKLIANRNVWMTVNAFAQISVRTGAANLVFVSPKNRVRKIVSTDVIPIGLVRAPKIAKRAVMSTVNARIPAVPNHVSSDAMSLAIVSRKTK